MENGFAQKLKTIPWFSKIGEPTERDSELKRIYRWEDWPGPEDPAVAELSLRQQQLYNEMMEDREGSIDELQDVWNGVLNYVISIASPTVPFDSKRDTWHPPTAAVWHAAWTAGLIALFQVSGCPIPDDLNVQWSWFKAGHWPCAWDGDYPHGKLVVF
jgi:hypothetical protein